MKILVIQHQESVTAGTLLDWVKLRHHDVHTHFFSNGNLPDNLSYDLLVICGGSANVDQEEEFPWLRDEKKFIRKAVDEKKKIVGLCLGGQLLAEILGGKVFRAPHWETGWQNVKILENGQLMKFFLWHGYQFLTPPGVIRTSESQGCPHQGFKIDNQIYAYQFHPEATVEWIRERALDPEKPLNQPYVQTGEEMLQGMHHHEAMKRWFFDELDALTLPRRVENVRSLK